MQQNREIVVGLDIGTTKICVMIAELVDSGSIRIIGVGNHPSRGLKKGKIVNIMQAVESIRSAVDKAENTCGFQINTVYAGITGDHIESFNSRAVLPVANPSVGVTEKDIINTSQSAGSVAIPRDREIIHMIPQEFSVDDQRGIADPEGMQGIRLEARVHLITAQSAAIRNITNCINQAGLDVADIVLQQLASSLAVVKKEEQQAGVVLVDIGGGTTDYVFFRDEIVQHTNVLSVGGDHLTNDISLGMKLLLPQAEELKKREGRALSEDVSDDPELTIPGSLFRSSSALSRRNLCLIIELRMTELFHLLQQDLEREEHFHSIGSGLVLTGGGSLLRDVETLAAGVTSLPVRIGRPSGVSGLREVIDNPIYSTAVGLVKYGLNTNQTFPSSANGSRNILGPIKNIINRYL
ncbi:MAG: cell division protein FtsA [Candidatus Auribacterota bacterium]|nr:cell division protein FtsA [Candidatus Auribacterota bacterium]